MIITKAQRKALKRVFDRQADGTPASYRQFRKTAIPAIGLQGVLMVRWTGMWLGIEADGYTHS